MAREGPERKLAAVLAADVAGYSRLIGADEEGTLARLRALRQEFIDPAISAHHGRIVKTTGDGLLIEFPSAVEAVRCAVEVQRRMISLNSGVSAEERIEFRVGTHVGDMVVAADDLLADAVNIAARLEGIAEPSGICLSRQAFDQIEGKLAVSSRRLGPRMLKNIAKPVEVYAIDLDDRAALSTMKQEIRYCRAPDGVRIAYATVGRGPPLVKAGNWMNHLEHDWKHLVWGHIWRELARDRTLIRYDARGNGLSDWEVKNISLEAWVSDLEAVVEAAGVTRFPLLGISQGCAVSIAYAVRHPEHVSHLILYGGFARGQAKRGENERQMREALTTLVRFEWGADTPAIRQLFTSRFMPEATKEQADLFNEWQRMTTSPECAARYMRTTGEIDVTSLLPKVAAPTLVMHARGDLIAPIAEGRLMADGIPGARFVALQGQNHVFLEHEPARDRFFEEIRLFLSK